MVLVKAIGWDILATKLKSMPRKNYPVLYNLKYRVAHPTKLILDAIISGVSNSCTQGIYANLGPRKEFVVAVLC